MALKTHLRATSRIENTMTFSSEPATSHRQSHFTVILLKRVKYDDLHVELAVQGISGSALTIVAKGRTFRQKLPEYGSPERRR
ncbi:MAG: hypothetical protein IPP44_25025 [Ideonella sp.]|nr:hypothetical protein [Ideonella sp.]